MEKPLLTGALLVAGAVASIGAVAGFVSASRPVYAEVVTVEPLTRAVSVQQQECVDPQAARGKSTKDPHRIAGTVIGGMVGGVIGHQIGDGRGQTVATVAGAAGGAYAGNRVQKAVQDKARDPKCRIVNRTEQKVYAYDVRYRLDGRLGKVRMEHAPGPRIPVKDGKLILPDATEEKT